MDKLKLDALVAPTMGPACLTDLVVGDRWLGGSSSAAAVAGYPSITVPAGFVFSAKVPQIITHDKALVDCGAELEEFLGTMGILGEKLGPIVLQFPSFDKWKMKDRHEFTDRREIR